MGVGFLRDVIRAWAFGCASTREKGQRHIETAPEKVDRTALTEKTRAVSLQDHVSLYQNMPEALGRDGIIGGMDLILIKADGTVHFTGQCVDRDLDAQCAQCCHKFLVKTGDGTRDQREGFGHPIAGENKEVVIDEIKMDLKDAAFLPMRRNGRRCQPTFRHIKWNMPPVVHVRTQCQPHLANDLSPHMQCVARVLPCLQRQRRPSFSCCSFTHLVCDLPVFLRLVSLLSNAKELIPTGRDVSEVKLWSSRLQHHRIKVTPDPIFSRLEGLNNRMVGCMEMLGRVLILG